MSWVKKYIPKKKKKKLSLLSLISVPQTKKHCTSQFLVRQRATMEVSDISIKSPTTKKNRTNVQSSSGNSHKAKPPLSVPLKTTPSHCSKTQSVLSLSLSLSLQKFIHLRPVAFTWVFDRFEDGFKIWAVKKWATTR
jgi:hypothetical protein